MFECSYKMCLRARFSSGNGPIGVHTKALISVCDWLIYWRHVRSFTQSQSDNNMQQQKSGHFAHSGTLETTTLSRDRQVNHCYSSNTLVGCFPFKFQKFTICPHCGLPARNILWWSVLWRPSHFIKLQNSSTPWQDGKDVHCKYLLLPHTKP